LILINLRKDFSVGKHLVLVGGGHAHLTTLANIRQFTERGHAVTVVAPSPYHYYSGMGPGMLGKTYAPTDIRFAIKRMAEKQGGKFLRAAATRVDPVKKKLYLDDAEPMSYDIISFNTGSYVPCADIVSQHGEGIFAVKPIAQLMDAQARLLGLVGSEKITVSIIGGGPSAVEIAGNVWRLAKIHGKIMPKIQVFAGQHLMSRYSLGIRKKTSASLMKRGIDIIERGYVGEVTTGKVILATGRFYRSDVIFLAHGIKPSPIFNASGLPVGPDGGMRVNKHLQSTAYPEIFGGGDCIHYEERPLDKVGVYAVRENPVLCHNLMAALEGRALEAFDPGGDYLLIFNMGDGTGVLQKKRIVFAGRPAFIIKDYIDRKFMKKFKFSAYY
jgi:NADH dehydrogenase FAD-containing subunit